MFRIDESSPEYRIFQPAADDFDFLRQKHAEWKTKNDAFLKNNPESAKPPETPLTGSFIYAHPPDYRQNMLNLTTAQWREVLTRLMDQGIDTVIFQAAAWNELKECYYPSSTLAEFRQWDTMSRVVEAASGLKGLTLFLGEYGSVASWQHNGTPDAFERETQTHLDCLDELFRLYRGGFQGMYFTSEFGFTGTRSPDREAIIARLFEQLFSKVREESPGMPVMLSPISFDCGDKLDGLADYWCSIFSRSVPDIIAPQDSVGTLCMTLDRQNFAYAQWKEAADRCKFRLWANIELFEVEIPAPGVSSLIPAKPERIAAQMRVAESYAEKLICWEALRFPRCRPSEGHL